MRFLRSNRYESLNRGCELIQQAIEIDLAFKRPEREAETSKLLKLVEKLLDNGGRGRILIENTPDEALMVSGKRLIEKYPEQLEINILEEECELSYSVLLVENSQQAHTIIGLDHLNKLGTLCKDNISIELPLSENDRAFIKNHLNELNKLASPII